MPNDIYRWQDGGGLVHHCPICKTPLAHKNAATRCVGKHVEWCGRYHTQLFRKNMSSECAPCRHSDEQHVKRHREIAELLRQLKEEQAKGLPPATPKTTRSLIEASSGTPGSSTKKDRKAAKKAAKLAEMPKVIATADVDFVAQALHPHDCEKDEAEEERRLIDDPDIKLNLYFHRGTANTRETRHAFIKRRGCGEDVDIEDSEVDALLEALHVPMYPLHAKETELVAAIRTAVREDVINVEKERQQTMMRKGGFWRWASRKVYNRLVANGRVWDDKEDENTTPKRNDSAVAADVEESVTAAGGCETPAQQVVEPALPTATVSTPPSSPENGGWTKVGQAKPKQPVLGSLKFCANQGLLKMKVKPKGAFTALSEKFTRVAGDDSFA